MNLLIDLGNTRIKWAYDVDGKLQNQGSAARSDLLPESMLAAWQDGPAPQRVVISSVVTDIYTIILNQAIQRLWGLRADYLRVKQGSFGIELVYEKPELFGIDRWLALVAAHQQVVGAVMFVSSGTALTIDLLTENGKHLGGVISPGIGLMQSSLIERAEGVKRGVAKESSRIANDWLGSDTHSGVDRGCLYAVTGAVEHLYTRAKLELDVSPSVIIAGGDAQCLADELGFNSSVIPNMVLQGMQIVISDINK